MGLVEMSGYRLELDAAGEGDPPVVLVPALGWDHTQWDQVRAELTSRTTLVTYNRPGLGRSDPAPDASPERPRTVDWAASQLHTLLDKANVPSPRILAGHSVGGLIVDRYAALFSADTAGLVILDATFPPLVLRECDVGDGLILDGLEGGGGIILDIRQAISEYDRPASPPLEPAPPCVVVSSALGRFTLNESDAFAPLSLCEVDGRWQEFQRRLAAQYSGDLIVAHFSDHILTANVPRLVAYVIDAVVSAAREHQPPRLDPDVIYNAGGRLMPRST